MASRLPIVRQTSWSATIPQFLSLTIAVVVCGWAFGSLYGLVMGAGVYLAYSWGSRLFVARHHRRGMSLIRQGRFAEAVGQFEEGYRFFARRPWLDRFRSVLLMSPSAIGYRELALLNIAFCQAQLGDGELAKQSYERTLREFPESGMAAAALKLIDSVKQADGPKRPISHP